MSISESLVRRKAALRAEQRRKRGALAAQLGAAATEGSAPDCGGTPAAPGAIVSGYWPLAGEFDPRPAMHRLARLATRSPAARAGPGPDAGPSHLSAWRPATRRPFQVLEPSPDAPLVNPRILLVPLLASDRAGRRLGYAAGYYDDVLRDLRERRPGTFAIGVAFAAQEVGEVRPRRVIRCWTRW